MIMRNGLQKINFLILLSFFFTSADIILAEDVQLSPLINLDQIEPSYDSFDETLIENRPDEEISDDNVSIDSNKIKNEVGWEPKYDFTKALDETVNWYLENQKWWEPLITEKALHPQPWTIK